MGLKVFSKALFNKPRSYSFLKLDGGMGFTQCLHCSLWWCPRSSGPEPYLQQPLTITRWSSLPQSGMFLAMTECDTAPCIDSTAKVTITLIANTIIEQRTLADYEFF